MRFAYTYKTSDGVRREAEISAPGRDEAFAALRLQGIRPIRVVALDAPQGHRAFLRRLAVGAALAFLSAAAGAAAFQMLHRRDGPSAADAEAAPRGDADGIAALPRPRGQVRGCASLDLGVVFRHPSEAYLARYAQPGAPPGEGGRPPGLEEDLIDHLKSPIAIMPHDSADVGELKRIVAGIKNDIALLLASGQGINEILAWLDARQKMEASYRRKIIDERKRSSSSKEETNRLLRTLGLEEIPSD